MEAADQTPRFTFRKFMALPCKQQHKKCAELLQRLYQLPSQETLSRYNELQTWLGTDALTAMDQEEISNRYHEHLRLAGLSVREHHLLPTVRKHDRTRPLKSPLTATAYLENIRSAHNVGSMLRTAEAFGLLDVRFSPRTPFIDHLQVIKTAKGAASLVKASVVNDLSELPRPLIVLETVESALPLTTAVFPPASFTLAVGNEEYGCSTRLLEEADAWVEIPLRGQKNSLNVANAFAIAVYEMAKAAQD